MLVNLINSQLDGSRGSKSRFAMVRLNSISLSLSLSYSALYAFDFRRHWEIIIYQNAPFLSLLANSCFLFPTPDASSWKRAISSRSIPRTESLFKSIYTPVNCGLTDGTSFFPRVHLLLRLLVSATLPTCHRQASFPYKITKNPRKRRNVRTFEIVTPGVKQLRTTTARLFEIVS